jgi:hypothetical protein
VCLRRIRSRPAARDFLIAGQGRSDAGRAWLPVARYCCAACICFAGSLGRSNEEDSVQEVIRTQRCCNAVRRGGPMEGAITVNDGKHITSSHGQLDVDVHATRISISLSHTELRISLSSWSAMLAGTVYYVRTWIM